MRLGFPTWKIEMTHASASWGDCEHPSLEQLIHNVLSSPWEEGKAEKTEITRWGGRGCSCTRSASGSQSGPSSGHQRKADPCGKGHPHAPHQGRDAASCSFPKPAMQRNLTSSSLRFRASFPNLSLKKNLDRAKFRPITLKCSHVEKSKVPRAKTEEGWV